MNAALYLRTLRHLRPRQIWTRAVRHVYRPRVSEAPHPPVREMTANPAAPIPASGGWTSPHRVRLLNLERDFVAGIDWRPEDMPRLWIYHLNYFDDLPESASDPDRSWLAGHVDAWIGSNPVGTPDTWDPYPISLRIVNWVKWLAVLEGERPEGVLQSLAVQARYLERRLEFDIMANHLFANAAALTAAGLFFGGREGDRWLGKGLRLLAREAQEQILGDGGHFERSPMYHAIVLGQILDIINLMSAFPGIPSRGSDVASVRGFLEVKVRAMLGWLALMVHPDGEFAFFNDTTLGVAPTLKQLRDYAARIGLESVPGTGAPAGTLGDSAFLRVTSDDERTTLLMDAGPPSPEYQMGHAHSEALSIEMSRDGRRLIVNSGVSTYKPGDERLRQRETAAHSTVRIDGEEQSELWASHRCGRRCGEVAGSVSAASAWGEHRGYAFLSGTPIHRRRVTVGSDTVTIDDRFAGEGGHLIEWFFHFHPDVSVRLNGRTVEVEHGGTRVGAITFPETCDVRTEAGMWRPGFNTSVPNTRVVACRLGKLPAEFRVVIRWA